MRRIFGAQKKKEPPPTLEQTADRMGQRGDKLDDKIKQLDEQLAKFRDQLKKTRPGPAQEGIKRRALQILKQKRLYENQRSTLYNQQFNVEQTRFNFESIQDTVQTVQAMKAANKEMKVAFKANKELDLNYIDKLQDELADMMDMTNEINEAMGRSYDVPEDLDEADLMAELDALEEDLATEGPAAEGGMPSYLQEPELPDLPNAPQQPLEEELGLPAVAQRT